MTCVKHPQPTSSPQIVIQFEFSCNSVFQLWAIRRQDSSSAQPQFIAKSDQHPLVNAVPAIHLRQFASPNGRGAIAKALENWSGCFRGQVIEEALNKAGEALKKAWPLTNDAVFFIDIHASVTHKFVYDERQDDDDKLDCPLVRGLVSLARNVLKVYSGTCSICLEDFSNAREYSAVYAPCGHTFHRICMGKWLGINHNCPNCRLQFPPLRKIVRGKFYSSCLRAF